MQNLQQPFWMALEPGPRVKAGSPVTGEDFFGRDREVESFWANVGRGHHLLLVSPRRVGKTSLMRHLERNPRDGWHPVFVNLEGKTNTSAVITEIVSRLHDDSGLGQKIATAFLKGLGALENGEVNILGIGAAIKLSAGKEWDSIARSLETAIKNATKQDARLLLILDEFPTVIDALFREDRTKEDATNLLKLFRKIRNNTDLEDRFRMVIGGSIGLLPVLRRHGSIADANDLKPFPIGPWSNETALAFMDAIAVTEDFDLPMELRLAILRLTGEEPIPYHLQVILDDLIELEKSASEITEDDVTAVWGKAILKVSLDHYRDRLHKMLEPEEVGAAETMLRRVLRQGPQRRQDLVDSVDNPEVAISCLRILEEDGYLRENDHALQFANPMLEAFWDRTSPS